MAGGTAAAVPPPWQRNSNPNHLSTSCIGSKADSSSSSSRPPTAATVSPTERRRPSRATFTHLGRVHRCRAENTATGPRPANRSNRRSSRSAVSCRCRCPPPPPCRRLSTVVVPPAASSPSSLSPVSVKSGAIAVNRNLVRATCKHQWSRNERKREPNLVTYRPHTASFVRNYMISYRARETVPFQNGLKRQNDETDSVRAKTIRDKIVIRSEIRNISRVVGPRTVFVYDSSTER